MSEKDLLTYGVMALIFITVITFIKTAARAKVLIRTPATTGQIDIGRHNEEQFKKGFSVRADLTKLDGTALHAEIKKLNLKSRTGEALVSFSVDKGAGFIVGSSHAATEITLVRNGSNGSEMLVSGRDRDGKFVALGPSQVGIFDLKGNHIGFDFRRFSEAREQRAYFVVLLDRSGSMSSVIGSVRQSAVTFMSSLPSNAHCRVLSFSHEISQHTRNFVPCSQAGRELGSIRAGGGTNLYGALVAAYAELAPITDSLKGVVLISDGVGDGGMTKAQVLQRKSAPTHVYFLGSAKKDQLNDIADTFIYGEQDAKKLIGRFFEQMADSIRNLAVITIKPR